MSMEVRNIRKTFGGFVALDDVSLEVEALYNEYNFTGAFALATLAAALALVVLAAKTAVEGKTRIEKTAAARERKEIEPA